MRFIHRSIEPELLKAAHGFPALLLTGPRRAGKTTLLRKLFPKASYYLLEDPDTIARIRSDPRSFLEEIKLPVILDEIQNAPELFNYVRSRIDAQPRKTGQWFLTGSQEAGLMKGVSESMAGRAAVFEILPFSLNESPKVSLLHGGFPEILQRPATRHVWFRSYLQTYLERDVRAVSAIKNLATFRRFLSLLAGRCGQILNKTDLAAPLGVSVPTLTEWLNILEVTGQIILVPPFYENFGKRLIKSPKLYFVDSGLTCHLLNIETQKMFSASPFAGALFEGFVASEIIKFQINSGKRKELYYFRDQQGLEVDFLVPAAGRRLILLEVKSTRTLRPDMGLSLKRLARKIFRYEVRSCVVGSASPGEKLLKVLSPGVEAVSVERLLGFLK